MTRDNADTDPWPELPYRDWRDTAVTLQLWTQILGKIRLSLTPWINHSWQVPLYVSARGLNTSAIPYGSELFERPGPLSREDLVTIAADDILRSSVFAEARS